MTATRSRRFGRASGFTILEALVGVTVIMVLLVVATFFMPRVGHGPAKQYLFAMRSALREIDVRQEAYYARHHTYADSFSRLDSIRPDDMQPILQFQGNAHGWTAVASHRYWSSTCRASRSRSAAGVADSLSVECAPGGERTAAYRADMAFYDRARALKATVPRLPDACIAATDAAVPPPVGEQDLGYPTHTVDQLAIRQMLFDRSFDALDRLFSAYADSVRADFRMEYKLWDANRTFYVKDTTLRSRLEDWVRQRPASANARLALGHYLTESDNYMDQALSRFVVDTALQLMPCNLGAYHLLVYAADDSVTSRRLLAEGLKLQPHSYLLRYRHIDNLDHGDSAEMAMERFAAASQNEATVNPRIVTLLGKASGNRGRWAVFRKEYERSMAKYNEALKYGDLWEYHGGRGEVFYHQKRYAEALAEFDRALAQRPQLADVLHFRSSTKYDLGALPQQSKGSRERLFQEAFNDIVLSVRLDPSDEQARELLAWMRKEIPQYDPDRARSAGSARNR